MAERSPELVALHQEHSPVRDDRARTKQKLGMAAFAGVGLLAAYYVLASGQPGPRNEQPAEEEFSTSPFRPPSFERVPEEQPKAPDDNIIQLPPPPPPPEVPTVPNDTTEFHVPPPPDVAEPVETAVPPPDAPPATVVEEPKEDEFPDRFRSKQIVVDTAQQGGAGLGGEVEPGVPAPLVAGEDSNSKFLASAASMGDRKATATKINRIDAVVAEGTLIPGLLETAIVSDLPGQIRAITSEDVYSLDGRRVVIPAGTRLIGEYQSEVITGQTRIFVVWTRLIRDDGVSVRLASIGTDSLGRSGVTGKVDKKYFERFGASALLSVIGGGTAYLAGLGDKSVRGNGDGNGNNGSSSDDAASEARQVLAQTFSDMANKALDEYIKVKPTISVRQGERIFIFVRQDLDFSAFYEDPVTEQLRIIKKERGLE